MARTIFIGDVHGCFYELVELFQQLNIQRGDRVIFVGDLVNKGPDSLGVLRFARTVIETQPGSVVVSGNHEEKALRDLRRGNNEGRLGEPWLFEASLEDTGFMESMPLTWYDPDINIRVVHGGIFPALLEKHPDVFERIEARGSRWRKGGGKVMNRARRMLRVRHVDRETGDMLALGANKPEDPFWADTYKGEHGVVIYGHSPWLDGEVRRTDWTLGIDTACVFGGKLTAAVFNERGIPDGIVQVDAIEKYAEPYKEDD